MTTNLDDGATEYEQRLADIRPFVAALRRPGLPAPAVHIADQASAAVAEASTLADGIARFITATEPGPGLERTLIDSTAQINEAHARTLAAMARFRTCPHLKANPMQPALARMPLRRVDCRRCAQTNVVAPSDEFDRCDWCGARGIETFYAVTFALGGVVVAGDACHACRGGIAGDEPPRSREPDPDNFDPSEEPF